MAGIDEKEIAHSWAEAFDQSHDVASPTQRLAELEGSIPPQSLAKIIGLAIRHCIERKLPDRAIDIVVALSIHNRRFFAVQAAKELLESGARDIAARVMDLIEHAPPSENGMVVSSQKQAELYLQLGQNERAFTIFDQSIEVTDTGISRVIQIVHRLMQKGYPEQAITLLRYLRRRFPQRRDIMGVEGRLRSRFGNDVFSSLDPARSDVALNECKALLLGRLDQATISRIISLAENVPDVQVGVQIWRMLIAKTPRMKSAYDRFRQRKGLSVATTPGNTHGPQYASWVRSRKSPEQDLTRVTLESLRLTLPSGNERRLNDLQMSSLYLFAAIAGRDGGTVRDAFEQLVVSLCKKKALSAQQKAALEARLEQSINETHRAPADHVGDGDVARHRAFNRAPAKSARNQNGEGYMFLKEGEPARKRHG